MNHIRKTIDSMVSISETNIKLLPYKKSKVDILNELDGTLKGYECQLCRNKGVIYYDVNGEIVSKKCSCLPIRQSVSRIKSSGLEEPLQNLTFETFKVENEYQKQWFDKAKSYAESGNGWFYMGGQVGAGKTHLCTAIAGNFLKIGKSLRYMQWESDSAALKQIANKPEFTSMIEPFKESDVLYIDDFFKTKAGMPVTPADIGLAFQIINYRYINKELITIISSERTLAEIVEIDEALGSRIYEMTTPETRINIKKDPRKNFRLKGAWAT